MVSQLQLKAGENIRLTLGGNGRLTYSIVDENLKLNHEAKRIISIIEAENITVNLTSVPGAWTSSGNLMIGGAFMGNEISVCTDGSVIATAYQEVNPSVLEVISNSHGKPGADMLHELTEAYEGAKISIKNEKSSTMSTDKNSVYQKAHAKASPQSGTVYERLYDRDGNETENIINAVRAEWYVENKQGQQIVIQ